MRKAVIAFATLSFVVLMLLAFGKKRITTDIAIDAPVDAVWSELTDFNSYPGWNPFIKKLSGEVKTGNTIEVTFQTRGSDPIVFTPRILLYEEGTVLQWEGRLFLPGIFTGRHTFRLTRLEDGKTKLAQEEDFNGILVPFFSFDSTVSGFAAMNAELKKRVENKYASARSTAK